MTSTQVIENAVQQMKGMLQWYSDNFQGQVPEDEMDAVCRPIEESVREAEAYLKKNTQCPNDNAGGVSNDE